MRSQPGCPVSVLYQQEFGLAPVTIRKTMLALGVV